jgi:phytoene dehydrogenase-like protein
LPPREGDLDVVVIGAGHNGLTCAAYLGIAGLNVRVLERRNIVGGAAVTEEFVPGYRNSVAAYTVSLLQPKIIRELALHRHGLRIVERRAQNFLPTPDHRYLLHGNGKTVSEIAKFNVKDAERYGAYCAEIGRIADLLRDLMLKPPPNVYGHPGRTLIKLLKFVALDMGVWELDRKTRRAVLKLFMRSAGDYLDSWFESDPIKATLGFDSIVGNLASPYSPGTAYALLHHTLGEVNGKKGIWGHAIGGMGAISQAIAGAAREHGVRIDTDAAVSEVIVDRDRAAGVVLEDGRQIKAKAVVANVNPKFLFEHLVPAGAIPEATRTRMQRWKCGSGVFRMNVALAGLPNFSARPSIDMQDHHTSGIIIGPSLGYMDRAYHDCRNHGWSSEPIIELLIPSTVDQSLAPNGAHVASLFCQHVSPQFADGSSWDAHREAVAGLMIDTVEKYAPGFRSKIVGSQILSPLDLEREFGLPNGDIYHGAMSLDQLFSARPILGYADYRMPLAGLYLCGAGAHPGGGVSGAPGHNAAIAVIRDLGVSH